MDRIILFTSYYFATKAEAYLLEQKIPLRLIATPPQLSNVCGLCILVNQIDLPRVKNLMVQGGITHTSIYTYAGVSGECRKIE